MFPDQNQTPPSPTPNPYQPLPPNPSEGVPAPQQPAVPELPVQPAAQPFPAAEPVQSQVMPPTMPQDADFNTPVPPAPETFPSAQPVVTPEAPLPATPPAPMPVTQPAAEPVAPAPIQPAVDSSQLGYVPPVMPVGPNAPLMGNSAASAKGSKFAKIRIILAVVVGLAVLSGGGLLLKDILFSGSKITTKDLVETTEAGVTFKHPKTWTKASSLGSVSGSFDAAYTEGGESPDKSDQAVMVGSVSLGGDYDSLSSSRKQDILSSITEGFKDPSSVESDNCKDVSDVKASKITQANYTDAVSIEYTCNKIKGREVKAKVKGVYGLKGSNADIVVIVAIDTTWNKSDKALDEILGSFKSAH